VKKRMEKGPLTPPFWSWAPCAAHTRARACSTSHISTPWAPVRPPPPGRVSGARTGARPTPRGGDVLAQRRPRARLRLASLSSRPFSLPPSSPGPSPAGDVPAAPGMLSMRRTSFLSAFVYRGGRERGRERGVRRGA